jgi:chromosome segregation ATPase
MREETNMLFKRLVGLFALAAGFLGLVACITGGYWVWHLASRIDQANESVFATVDKGLASAQDRIRGVQKRVRESKMSTGKIAQNLRDWSKSRAKERLVSTVEIQQRADKLAGHLQTADQWLVTATETIRGLQHVLELGAVLGAPVDPLSLEKVLDELTSIQGRLQDTEQPISDVRDFAVDRAGESEENRLSRVLKLLASTELATGAINTRLEDSVTRLSQMQTEAQQLKTRIGNYILRTTIECYLVLAWIAAGQVALCLCGWRNCRRSRSSPD